MEKTQHTPGPWRRDYGGGYGQGHIYADDQKFGEHSLAAAHFPALYEGGRGGFNEEAVAIMEANARLIAAAPDLLDALRALVIGAEGTGEQPISSAMRRRLRAARAALAQATGSE